ncbi:unnamed protein product, partial [marine sediment metagenome]
SREDLDSIENKALKSNSKHLSRQIFRLEL